MTRTDNRPQQPIVNCHTHIFKGEHVPPYLAKSFVPNPVYKWLSVPRILWLAIAYRDRRNKKYKDPYRQKEWDRTERSIKWGRNRFWGIIKKVLGTWITFHALFALLGWIGLNDASSSGFWAQWIGKIHEWLLAHYVMVPLKSIWLQIPVVLLVFFFVRSGRNLLWFILSNTYRFLRLIPGKMTQELIERYMLLGRFAMYKDQGRVFSRLQGQYPKDTRFIVLPMDMEYMDAGKPKPESCYPQQMEELARLKKKHKDIFLPFVFVDPRRIADDPNQFKYTLDPSSGEVKLEDCFIKQYIEDKAFDGFKIYPALGYYVFDEHLLAVWKYAAQHDIPIMTHCIKGTIFYRGKKEKQWDHHPIFKEYTNLREAKLEKLLLPQRKNADFSLNFTHPLNYLILLKEELLRIWVGQCSEKTQALFGYTNDETPLKSDLSDLKICFAHFGGDDQWQRYLELDRYDYAKRLMQEPDKGINFLYTKDDEDAKDREISWKKLEDCWKKVDWYSIICSLMLQHKNVYADISYILHNESIFDLLKETINNPKLGKKVLFGTDFYVVRNHKSEKNLLVQTKGSLDYDEFDLIARENPIEYLKRT